MRENIIAQYKCSSKYFEMSKKYLEDLGYIYSHFNRNWNYSHLKIIYFLIWDDNEILLSDNADLGVTNLDRLFKLKKLK